MHILILLGLCGGYVPNDIEMSNFLCKAEMQAKYRKIEVENPMDEFDRVYFDWQMSKKV